MSYMNIIGKNEITRRKTKSDLINDTEELTFTGSEKTSSHVFAAKQVRDRKAALEIRILERQTDEDLLNEYDLDDIH